MDVEKVAGIKRDGEQQRIFRIQIFECILAAFCIVAALVLAGTLIYHNTFPFGILDGILMYAMISAMGLVMLGVNKYFSFLPGNIAETLAKIFGIVILLNFIFIALLYFSRSIRLSPYYFIVADAFLFLFLFFIKRISGRMKTELLRNRLSLVIGKVQGQNSLLEELRRQKNERIGFAAFDHPKLEEYLKKADNVYLSGLLSKKFKDQIISYCVFHSKKVYVVPHTYEIAVRKSEMTQVGDIPIFAIDSFRLTEAQNIVKRFCDIFMALIGIGISSPIMFYAAIRIKKEDGGPVFFKQVRSGQNGKEFQVIKFRSMVVDAEKYTGAVFAKEGDPRITKIGKLMRATRIDEIPQFFNVLIGDMSMVGPRPERPVFVEEFRKQLPEYISRLAVKPGITGLAQVMGNYTTSAENKIKFDLVYIRNYSFWLDFKILVKTFRVVFRKEQSEGFSKQDQKQHSSSFDPELIFQKQEQPSAAGRTNRIHRIGKAIGVMLCCTIVITGSLFLRCSTLAMTMIEAATPDEVISVYADTKDLADAADLTGAETPNTEEFRATAPPGMSGSAKPNKYPIKTADASHQTGLEAKEEPEMKKGKALSDINTAEKIRMGLELLSKLNAVDLMALEELAEGGFTAEEKEQAKFLMYERFNALEIAYIKGIYEEYVE